MAKLTDDDVLRLARLARLHLSRDEIKRLKGEISAILGYVEQLQKVDLDDLPPTHQVTGLQSVMRPDVILHYGATADELLRGVPAVEAGLIKVKRVLE